MVSIDIIMLSYAKNADLKNVTQQSIDTLLESEDRSIIHFNIIVLESNKSLKPFIYSNCKTIYPNQKFGYHKFLNIGISATNNPYLCLCNNDLIFHKNWASEILKAINVDHQLYSLSPACPLYHKDIISSSDNLISYGYEKRSHITGWAIFVKRDIFNIIGKLDEHFKFWYCDDDYIETLKHYNIKHAIVYKSLVTHLESTTINNGIISKKDRHKFTYDQKYYFDYKWGRIGIFTYFLKLLKANIKYVLYP
jgi:GT2 family glycosyltransferase